MSGRSAFTGALLGGVLSRPAWWLSKRVMTGMGVLLLIVYGQLFRLTGNNTASLILLGLLMVGLVVGVRWLARQRRAVLTPTGPDGLTWLYRSRGAYGELLYVGITNNLGRRLLQHADTSRWFGAMRSFDVTSYDTRADALEAERLAIRNEDPAYNVVHSDRWL